MELYDELYPDHKSAQRVAELVLQHIGAHPHNKDIVRAVQFPNDNLDNIKLIQMLISLFFPASSVSDVTRWAAIEDLVLEVMARVYLRTCNNAHGVSRI